MAEKNKRDLPTMTREEYERAMSFRDGKAVGDAEPGPLPKALKIEREPARERA